MKILQYFKNLDYIFPLFQKRVTQSKPDPFLMPNAQRKLSMCKLNVCSFLCMCMQLPLHLEAQKLISVFLSHFSIIVFDRGLSPNLDVTSSARLAAQQMPGIFLSPPPQCWAYRQKNHQASCLVLCVGAAGQTQVLMLS